LLLQDFIERLPLRAYCSGPAHYASLSTRSVLSAVPAFLPLLQDFIERLPLRAYTDPRLGRGPLNLASALLPRDNPTDLGPKGYLAYGR
jgi:hypothetical protein